jgi:prophage regulatory protein
VTQQSQRTEACDRLLALPHVLHIVTVSRSTFWLGVKQGRYPKPVRISARRVAWRESDILALVRKGVQHG